MMRFAHRLFPLWLGWVMAQPCGAGPMLPPAQTGNVVSMTNANVRLDYDLSTGRADFYWQGALKVAGFYAGVGLYANDQLTNYVTGTVYSNRAWTVDGNTVRFTLTKPGLPEMRQIFILEQDNSFLTCVSVVGNQLQSRWMGPVVMDLNGGVEIGSDNDNRALIVPFDNDSFTFSYNAMPINNTGLSYEVSAFYDNTTRHGLVVGSVTHDTWKTGVYFQGAASKLNVLNVFGGVTSPDTRDVMEHGLVRGSTVTSPTVFVGFGADWRDTIEDYANANAALEPKLEWEGGVPFGWNSWYAYGTGLNYADAVSVSDFIRSDLQTNHFNNRGLAYVNLDSFWDNLSDSQLAQFASHCHDNGQKAGIYWTPFVFWGTPEQGTNWQMTATPYKWSEAYLRTADGSPQVIDGGVAIDPTHPGWRQLAQHYLDYFKSRGFDYLKLDFLTHGALEGVHYDTNVMTGIQAYNQGMAHLVALNAGRMFLSESIAPIFPYQYAHARRIYCDTAASIHDTMRTMQAVTYGWWINDRLYRFSDPDLMRFSGVTANENQSRLINCAVAGTVFLNSDDLASAAGQNLARNCLTNAAINEVAGAGVTFRPVEGNTGSVAADVFVRQEGGTWYVAVFNYDSFVALKSLNLERLGIAGVYSALDLWSGATATVSGSTWNVGLEARQAKLFRLGTGATSATGPTNRTLVVGASSTLTTTAEGVPPFSYAWMRNGLVLPGATANSITLSPLAEDDAGVYAVIVAGANGTVTNSATMTLAEAPELGAAFGVGELTLNWPPGNTGWQLQCQTNHWGQGLGADWWDITNSNQTNRWILPINVTSSSIFFRLRRPF